jgi:hypothetical protein
MTGPQRTAPFQTPPAAVATAAPAARAASAIGGSFHTLSVKVSAPAAFTWGLWVVVLLCTLGFVATYGTNLPYRDDFALVPPITGHQHVSLAWLWSQVNEHRIPLTKVTLLFLYKLTNNDFRAGMFLSVLLLAAMALAMIIVAQRLRSGPSYADAIFPLALLHWGHAENLLWSIQISVVQPVVLACCLLLIIVTTPGYLSPRRAILTGLCLLLLPLCGAYGVVFTLALALWPAACGIFQLRASHKPKFHAILPLVLAGAALLFAAAYFIHYRATDHDTPGSLGGALTSGLQVMSLTFGPAAGYWWPYSGVLTAALLIVGATGLGALFAAQPQCRLRTFGLVCFVVAFSTLAFAIGWGRPHSGFTARYTTLVTPIVLCTYLIYQLFQGRAARLVSMGLFTVVCAACSLNGLDGLNYAKAKRDACLSFEGDIRAGKPCLQLATRYSLVGCDTAEQMMHPDSDRLSNFMCMLHDAGIGPFRDLKHPQAYVGNLDTVDSHSISGWIVNCQNPSAPVELEVRDGDTVVARGLTDQIRNLEAAEFGMGRQFGTGRYGYDIPTPAGLKDGRQHMIRVRVSGVDFDLANRPLPITLPVRPLKNPRGHHGYTDCQWIRGWVWDSGDSDAVFQVDVYDGITLLGTVTADQFRSDLRDAGIGTGKHGFALRVPASLRNGKPHTIRVRLHGTDVDLADTPQTISCPSE